MTNVGVMMPINLVTFLSFCWYFSVRAEIIPLAIAPVRDAAPKGKPLTTKGKLKSVGMLSDILGKGGLRNLGFDIPRGKVTARQAVMLNKAAEELPSASDITKVDDIELQEIAEKASDLIFQIKDVQTDTDDLFEHPLRELPGLDIQLQSIRGSLKVEVAKRFSWKSALLKSVESSRNFENILDFTMLQ